MLWHTKMNPNVAQLAPKLFELAMQTKKISQVSECVINGKLNFFPLNNTKSEKVKNLHHFPWFICKKCHHLPSDLCSCLWLNKQGWVPLPPAVPLCAIYIAVVWSIISAFLFAQQCICGCRMVHYAWMPMKLVIKVASFRSSVLSLS